MLLSVILISYNSLHFLKPCLEALTVALNNAREDSEIVLIDNGSMDGTLDFVRESYPEIRLLGLASNRGVAYARNRGMEMAKGRYVLLLDVDTIPNREAIEGMVAYMEKHTRTGLCGVRLVDLSGAVQDSCKRFPAYAFKANNVMISLSARTGLYSLKKSLERRNMKYHYSNIADIRIPFSPDYLIGACQMIRREVILKIGLLDENIFYGPEDADYCIRVKQADYDVTYLPQFRIVHLWQRSTSRKIVSKLALKHVLGLIYFYKKHRRLN